MYVRSILALLVITGAKPVYCREVLANTTSLKRASRLYLKSAVSLLQCIDIETGFELCLYVRDSFKVEY